MLTLSRIKVKLIELGSIGLILKNSAAFYCKASSVSYLGIDMNLGSLSKIPSDDNRNSA